MQSSHPAKLAKYKLVFYGDHGLAGVEKDAKEEVHGVIHVIETEECVDELATM